MGDADADRGSAPWGRGVRRCLHALWVALITAAVVLPNVPTRWIGPVSGWMGRGLGWISFKQHWAMYAPDPLRSLSYMELWARFPEGDEHPLEENVDVEQGWGTTWAGKKSRRDIWHYYAVANPNKRNDYRVWYLRGVCVCEARKGRVPDRIAMYAVKRRFTPPNQVRAGAPELGPPDRRIVTVQYCNAVPVDEMIAEDRRRRGQGDG